LAIAARISQVGSRSSDSRSHSVAARLAWPPMGGQGQIVDNQQSRAKMPANDQKTSGSKSA